jgi:hypothetical protein
MINDLLSVIEESIIKIGEEIIENRGDLNKLRKNLLEINEKNVESYIKSGENYTQYSQVNEKINYLLKSVKRHQRTVHDNNKCCLNCRFC